MRGDQERASELIPGWSQLRHTGLLLDGSRLHSLNDQVPEALGEHVERRLRQRAASALGSVGDGDGSGVSGTSEFIAFVLEQVCGFDSATGNWERGSRVPASQGRRAVTGEMVKPRHVWTGPRGATLPVFIDGTKRIGVGRGRRVVSRILGWLRAGGEHLALVTNGRQWRLLFAGLDYDASCEWDTELWFEEGRLAPQVTALRTLLQPALWTPAKEGAASLLLQAIRDTRKGQADLSAVLGERVREAVEILVQSHGEALRELAAGDQGVAAADIYRAACRVAMRAVVILFAESRELLPRTAPVYDEGYGLNGLFGQLERSAARGDAMSDTYGAWARVLALFRLVFQGSHHPDLTVHAYGGKLFAPGRSEGGDGVSRALHVFENTSLGGEVLPDRDVYRMLRLLTRTKAKIRQGKAATWVTVPVDFSDLSSEYIGIVYEGLLDYELKTAPPGDPVVFVAAGDRPALPLSRLEEMDTKALRGLFEKLRKDTTADAAPDEEEKEDEAEAEDGSRDTGSEVADGARDVRRTNRTRAEEWARRAVEVAGLVGKTRDRKTPEGQLAHERKVAAAARKLVHEIVLPGEWYLARWGGTRKGSGSFYTRPGLAVPTVQRTLRPLAYDPPTGLPPEEARDAPPAEWTPKRPEEILSLKVCDPACGSGSFALAALRFLTDALYVSLQHHGRIEATGSKSLVWLLGVGNGGDESGAERLSDEQIPCRPDEEDFEPRLRARLRRHVVERCIYAVDLDPLAVELCRLSLWVETMDRDLPFGFLDHKVKFGNALVGAWFDQFQHYPAIAWKNREGGDKNHSNGVHFAKNTRGNAIKGFHKDVLTPDMKRFLEGATLFEEDLLEVAATAHRDAIEVLAYMHELPVQDAAERADVYRKDFLGSAEWRRLKDAMDLWCACWFWPADEIEHAPLPTAFADPPPETRAVAGEVAARHRFFHWELEFPDVFREEGAGFDAVLGNPPWDVAKPVSMEFFSNIDPLYRSYGKQEALGKQSEYFGDEAVERGWLDYCADFRAQSNFVSRARNPFGDPEETDKSLNRIYFGKGNLELHRRWRAARRRSTGFADSRHPFRHQGSADLNLYKLFLEAAHAFAREGGRIGFLVPSGLYSDSGTGDLRTLFLEHCRWEWLFGIENSGKIFPIHRSYKFNPVVIEKGGSTEAIRTAFMRRTLEDWERAEELATPYTRAQVEQFSPKSRAILEIQSRRDLEILEKIYANSVLLGDDGPEGWGIKYATEFHMTNDSKLFPPRPEWEAKGYRPDEYSRWLKGDWRPIEELWAELGVDPDDPVPAEIELEDWLFDTSAGPERREAEARFVHGHLLKPGDVARTDWAVRCAQPPYDRLPVPRTAIPPGYVLSRDGTEFIWEGTGVVLALDGDEWEWEETGLEDVALPLYQGIMIQPFNPSARGWISGTGLSAHWDHSDLGDLTWNPQYLMSAMTAHGDEEKSPMSYVKIGFRDISRDTDVRSFIGALQPPFPSGHSAPVFQDGMTVGSASALAFLNSFPFDWQVRQRGGAAHLIWSLLAEMAVPSRVASPTAVRVLGSLATRLNLWKPTYAPAVLSGPAWTLSRRMAFAVAPGERHRLRVAIDAITSAIYDCDGADIDHILSDVDWPVESIKRRSRSLNPRGFWRVDRNREPELRHSVLTQIAFRDLATRIHAADGDRDQGIRDFLAQNDGEGWLLPETLRLADYGLGHDDRARHHQPVAARLGPRFYDWQLAQGGDESWGECHLHARNLLGHAEYAQLLDRLIEHRLLTGDHHHDLLFGQFTRDLVWGGTEFEEPVADGITTGDGRALRAAQRKPGYSAESSAKPPQKEMFRGPQTDLFE